MKKGKGLTINIHLTNRWLYTFIAILILAIIGVGVYALTPGVAPNPGHLISDVAPPSGCAAGQFLEYMNGAWICANAVDPAVMSWAKTNNPNIPGNVNASFITSQNGYIGGGLYGWCRNSTSSCDSSQETVSPSIAAGVISCGGNTGRVCVCLNSGGSNPSYVVEPMGSSGSSSFYTCYKKILS